MATRASKAMQIEWKNNALLAYKKRLEDFKNTNLLQKNVGRALIKRATSILRVSKAMVPVDTGALRTSGHVPPPHILGTNRILVEIKYGGAAADYAHIVHENVGYQYRNGRAKYLEIPFNAERDDTLEALAYEYRTLLKNPRALGRGGRRPKKR